jgi:hypothetical protein
MHKTPVKRPAFLCLDITLGARVEPITGKALRRVALIV